MCDRQTKRDRRGLAMKHWLTFFDILLRETLVKFSKDVRGGWLPSLLFFKKLDYSVLSNSRAYQRRGSPSAILDYKEETRDWKLLSRFRFGQQSTYFGGFYSRRTVFQAFEWTEEAQCVDDFQLFCSLNANSKQGNAYSDSTEKVSVNYKQIIFDLMPHCP